jgi:spore coat polysaccharide biosynthesis protein SpsF (cytidylyltransferase family)
MRLDGTQPDQSTEGDYSQTVQIESAIKRHRAAAFAILDRYVSAAAAASASVSKYHVVKVNGR